MTNSFDLNLSVVPEFLRDQAQEDFEKRDALGLMRVVERNVRLWLVEDNIRQLQATGMYEAALLEALTDCTYSRTPLAHLLGLLSKADPQRLRAAGDPLPGPGPFRLVSWSLRRGRMRRVRGLHWTTNPAMAAWFAMRYVPVDPAVYVVDDVSASAVFAYVNDRNEEDFLLNLPRGCRPRRLDPMPEPRVGPVVKFEAIATMAAQFSEVTDRDRATRASRSRRPARRAACRRARAPRGLTGGGGGETGRRHGRQARVLTRRPARAHRRVRVEEAAAIIGCSVRWLRQHGHTLPSYRRDLNGRRVTWLRSALLSWMQGNGA